MKLLLILLSVWLIMSLVAGCANLNQSDMTAAQLRATNGTATCATSTSIYGKVSIIAANTDDAAKGTTQKGSMRITCGDAIMQIDNNIGLPK